MKKFIVGRGKTVDFQIDDSAVSRQHAEVILNSDESITIRDLGSHNGTFVVEGGQKVLIKSAQVSRSDQVFFGETGPYKIQDLLLGDEEVTAVTKAQRGLRASTVTTATASLSARRVRCADCGVVVKLEWRQCPECGADVK